MPKTMPRQVGNDYSASSVKYLFEELFQSSHDHLLRSTYPAAQEGNIGDIALVDTGSVVTLCIKTSRGWFKSSAFTAL